MTTAQATAAIPRWNPLRLGIVVYNKAGRFQSRSNLARKIAVR